MVQYFGFEYLIGKVAIGEIVQLDGSTRDVIGALIAFTLCNKSIREFERFEKAIHEIQVWR